MNLLKLISNAKYFKKLMDIGLKSKMNIILKSGGALLLITGILMITNQLQALGFYLLEIFPFLQNFG